MGIFLAGSSFSLAVKLGLHASLALNTMFNQADFKLVLASWDSGI